MKLPSSSKSTRLVPGRGTAEESKSKSSVRKGGGGGWGGAVAAGSRTLVRAVDLSGDVAEMGVVGRVGLKITEQDALAVGKRSWRRQEEAGQVSPEATRADSAVV